MGVKPPQTPPPEPAGKRITEGVTVTPPPPKPEPPPPPPPKKK